MHRLKLCCLLPLLFLAVQTPGQVGGSSRDPFVLELPDISGDTRYVRPIVRTASRDLRRLRIRVIEPYARTIRPGVLVVTLNGDGIIRGCDRSFDLAGHIATCHNASENRLGGFTVLPGKNILEVSAVDKAGRAYYASYVIMLGDRSAGTPPEWKSDKPERFRGQKHAIIVGVSNYRYQDAGLRSLDFADDDARAVAELLRTPAGGGFSSTNVKLLIDADASLLALRSALKETSKRAKREDLVFIFFAGHGAPDPVSSQNLYFLFHDTKVVDMPKTAFPMAELKLFLDTQIAAERVFVMIDTCHSAGVNQKTTSLITGRELTREGDENNISNFYLAKQLANERGRAIITSSDVNEVSEESSKWNNHGVFTWAFLEGLKGGADSNKDNIVTAGEAFHFIRTKVQAETNLRQNPIALPGTAMNLPLATVASETKP